MDHISFQIFNRRKADLFSERDVMILFNLSGNLSVEINEKQKVLKQNDIVVVNEMGRIFFDDVKDDSLFVVFVLDGEELQNCYHGKRYTYICDSSDEFNSDHERLKKYLTDILVTFYESDEYRYMKINKQYYDMVFFLINHFASEIYYDKTNTREELVSYVNRHYSDDLSLKSVADDFGMNDQYFSKYFKKHVGKSYYAFVIETRMMHARKQIASGNKKISQIAMDCGFANLSSFNSYFKKLYDQTPMEYRESLKTDDNEINDEAFNLIMSSLQYTGDKNTEKTELCVDALNRHQYYTFWSDMINFGDPSGLDNAEINEQLKVFQKDLKQRYLRLELDDSAYSYEKGYTFSKDAVRLDKLYVIGYVPWLVIDYRKVTDENRLISYLKELLSFFANRQSIHHVRNWRIEIAYNSIFDDRKLSALFRLYDRVYRVMNTYKMNSRPLGFAVSLGNRDGLKKLYEYMNSHSLHVESQTFTRDPFIFYELEGGTIGERRDKSTMHDEMINLKMIAGHYGQDVERIYVVSDTDNTLAFNVIGDSCWKGAEMVKEFISCFEMLSGYSYLKSFDIMEKGIDTKRVLFGGGGAMSRDGIKKPAYHCLSMFTRVGDYYIGKNDNAIIFANDDGNFSIISHNAKPLGHRYYMKEGQFSAKDIDQCFDDLSNLSLHIRIDNIENGNYIVKAREVSPEGGSVQENYVKMTQDEEIYIHPNDIEFLRQVSIPMISVYETRVNNGVLEMDISLRANAFSLIHLVKQY